MSAVKRIDSLGDMLLSMGLVGAPVAYGVSKGIENVDKKYEPMSVRLQKVTPVNTNPLVVDEQMKQGSEKNMFQTFREKREKTAAGTTLTDVFNPNLLFGSALTQGFGLGSLMQPTTQAAGYSIYDWAHPGIKGMIRYTAAPEKALEAGAKEVGKGLGALAMSGTRDMINSLITKNKQVIIDSPRRKMILDQLRREDDVIAKMPIAKALETFHTMAGVAPTLSTDKNAVRSFLRTVAVNPMGGLDWNTIKGLAEAETAVKRAKGLIPTKQ